MPLLGLLQGQVTQLVTRPDVNGQVDVPAGSRVKVATLCGSSGWVYVLDRAH